MSKTIVGNVVQLNMNTQVAKKDGGSYPGWKMIYNTPDGQTQTIAKHANSLKFQPSLASVLNTLAAGDDFTMEMEKRGEFWEIVSIAKGANMPSAAPAQQGDGNPTRQYKSDRTSTYETPEERALRQALIVRQSSVTSAIALNPAGKLATILKDAAAIEAFVWKGMEDKKAPERASPDRAMAAPEVE